MRLRPDQLQQHLGKQLQPIYLISGDEPLLVQECCDAIRQHCRQHGFVREVMHADQHFDWNALLASASAMSLFADRQLIDLRLPSGKPGDSGSKALIEYAENPSPDNLLMISCGKLDSSATRSKWYKAIDSVGVTIPCWPVEARDLPRWIAARIQQAGMRADGDAIRMLADRVEGNLLAAVQEIEKLRLYAEGEVITTDTITEAVADNARYDVFGLVDRAMAGEAADSVRMLRGLRAEGTEPTIILWALSRELRTLYQCAEQIQQGNGIDRVLDSLRIWDKRKGLTKTALRRLNLKQLQTLITLANETDQAIKGMIKRSSWDLLDRLVLGMAGKVLTL